MRCVRPAGDERLQSLQALVAVPADAVCGVRRHPCGVDGRAFFLERSQCAVQEVLQRRVPGMLRRAHCALLQVDCGAHQVREPRRAGLFVADRVRDSGRRNRICCDADRVPEPVSEALRPALRRAHLPVVTAAHVCGDGNHLLSRLQSAERRLARAFPHRRRNHACGASHFWAAPRAERARHRPACRLGDTVA
eukprot:Amastigsp_a679092_14.p2 type:complete len:193 gc:universal Amastigsp_a679092_14:437-1015(+)